MKQKKKETVKKQVAEPAPKPKPKVEDKFADVKYDPQSKSWVGPVTANKDTSKVMKMHEDRERQLQTQDAASLAHNRKKVQRTQTPNLEEDEDCATVGEDLNLNSAHIQKPFNLILQDAKSAKWGATALPGDRTYNSSSFEKPSKTLNSHVLSPNEQIKRMEEEMGKKNREISLLRTQLEKAHRENHTLVEKIHGFTGKRYEDIAIENTQLKETVRLLNRKNVLLEGEKRKENNTKIHQLERDRELEELHAAEWQKNTLKPQNQEMVVVKVERKDK